MSQLIDLCGKAIHFENIKSFEKGKREYVYCPCFEESLSALEETKNLFGKKERKIVKTFRYMGGYPYGALLNDNEKPSDKDRYAIKSDGGFIINKMVDKITEPIGNVARMVSDKIGIDRSKNKNMRIWTRGQRLAITKWGDIPAKIKYADNRFVDVYPNSVEYNQLDNTITPFTKVVPTLEVHMNNNITYVFFGDNIDIAEVDTPYQYLLSIHNTLELSKHQKKNPFFAPRSSKEKIQAMNQLLQAPVVIQQPNLNNTTESIPVKNENNE